MRKTLLIAGNSNILKSQLKRFSKSRLTIPSRLTDTDNFANPTPNKLKIINQMSRALVASPRGRGRPRLM